MAVGERVLVRRPLLWFALAGVAVVGSFVMVLFIAVAADQDVQADDGLSGVVCASPGARGAAVAGFGARQVVNAGLVVAVGKEMRLPQRAWVVATAAAMTESHLAVLANTAVPESLALPHERVGANYDSVGCFSSGPPGARWPSGWIPEARRGCFFSGWSRSRAGKPCR
jgi:hypothetical protein